MFVLYKKSCTRSHFRKIVLKICDFKLPLEKTSAILLRKIPYSETSEIVTMISPSIGKITMIAKGSRRAKNLFAGVLAPLKLLQLDYYSKPTRTVQNLKEASIKERFPNLELNLEHMTVASVMTEIALKTTPENTETKDNFLFLLNAFRFLNQPCKKPKNALFRFWIRWLEIIGYRPNLTICDACRQPLRKATFTTHTGDMNCEKCTIGKARISNRTLLILLAFQGVNTSEVDSIPLNLKTQREIQFFLKHFSKFHVQSIGNLKSLTVYDQMFS